MREEKQVSSLGKANGNEQEVERFKKKDVKEMRYMFCYTTIVTLNYLVVPLRSGQTIQSIKKEHQLTMYLVCAGGRSTA